MTKKQYNYNFERSHDYTKQDIQQLTGLSKNTIPPSLKLAGLATSRTVYSGEELLTFFVPVRRLLDSGMSHEQVREILQMSRANNSEGSSTSRENYENESGLNDFEQELGEGIVETVYGTVEAAVDDFVEHIPTLTAMALSEAARKGKIRDAFRQKLREYFASRKRAQFNIEGQQSEAVPKYGVRHFAEGYDLAPEAPFYISTTESNGNSGKGDPFEDEKDLTDQ